MIKTNENSKVQNEVQIDLYNLAVSGDNKTYGRVRRLKTLSEEQLINSALAGSGFSKDQFIAAYNLVKEAAINEIADGASVSFGLGRYYLTSTGIFDGEKDTWDQSRNKLNVNVTPTRSLRQRVSSLTINVRGYAPVGGIINALYQSFDEKIFDNKIIPHEGLTIVGKDLKIQGDSPEVGVKFINIETNEATSVAKLLTNQPSKLQFVVPSLVAGEYRLAITTQFNGSKDYKTPQTIEYNEVLLVE